MFETVIVPLDGSSHAEFAIPYAIDEAQRRQAKLVLIHVIPRPEPCMSPVRRSGPLPWQGEWPVQELETAECAAQAYLEDVVARFGLDPRTRLCVAVGDPGVRVAAEAIRHERSLVVMLTGDRTRETSPPLSLVTSYQLIAGAVPVLGIPQPLSSDHQRTPHAVGKDEVQLRLTRPGPVMAPSVLTAVPSVQRRSNGASKESDRWQAGPVDTRSGTRGST